VPTATYYSDLLLSPASGLLSDGRVVCPVGAGVVAAGTGRGNGKSSVSPGIGADAPGWAAPLEAVAGTATASLVGVPAAGIAPCDGANGLTGTTGLVAGVAGVAASTGAVMAGPVGAVRVTEGTDGVGNAGAAIGRAGSAWSADALDAESAWPSLGEGTTGARGATGAGAACANGVDVTTEAASLAGATTATLRPASDAG
jgi:hypothetical protein